MSELFIFIKVLISVSFSTVVFSAAFGGLLYFIDLILGGSTIEFQVYAICCAAIVLIIRLVKMSWYLDNNL